MIRLIPMHGGPHFDEWVALVLLRRYGKKRFPGVERASLVFWDFGGATPDGKPAADWLERGALVIGQGYGMFDEHPCPERGILRKKGHSTSSLVARELGLPKGTPIQRAVQWLVDQVTKQDLNGVTSPLSIESVLSAMCRNGVPSPEMVEFGVKAVEQILDDQIAFQEEFDKSRQDVADTVGNPDGSFYNYTEVGNCTLAFAYSTSERACTAARCRGATLVIRHDPVTRHVTIMADKKRGLPMEELASRLRRHSDPTDFAWTDVQAKEEGWVGPWYFHPAIGLITTGGNRVSAGLQSPKGLNIDEVMDIATNFLEEFGGTQTVQADQPSSRSLQTA